MPVEGIIFWVWWLCPSPLDPCHAFAAFVNCPLPHFLSSGGNYTKLGLLAVSPGWPPSSIPSAWGPLGRQGRGVSPIRDLFLVMSLHSL